MALKRVVVGMLTGLLMLAIAAPAAGAQRATRAIRATTAEAATDRLPAGPGTFTAAPGQRPHRQSATEILAGVRGYRDLDAWLGATADAIRATSGATVVTAPTAPEEEPTQTEETQEVPDGDSGRVVSADPAGDLDGDGLDDVVAYHWDLDTWRAVLEARRGDTGELLWERAEDAEGGLAWPLGEDLSGDGTADLLVYDFAFVADSLEDCDGEEDDECLEQPWEATFRWTVGLVNGADGASVWSRAFDGRIRESYGYTSESPAPMVYEDQYSYAVEGENLYVIPFAGDLDGNGLSEVIVNAIDLTADSTNTDSYAWTNAGGAGLWEGESSIESATRVDIVDDHGETVRLFGAEGGGQVSLLWPIAQPDGSTDVVLENAVSPAYRFQCVYAYALVQGAEACPVEEGGEDAVEVSLLDGVTFSEQWSTTVPGWGIAWPLGADLDADGRNDVAVWTLDWEAFEERTYLLGGATGAPLWDDGVVIRDVLTTGPLNGDAGDDVLAIDYTESYSGSDNTYTFTLHLQRRDGTTGELQSETSHTVQDRPTEDGWFYEVLFVTAGDDANGDTAPDLTVTRIGITEHETDDGWWTFEYGPSSGVAESGVDGGSLYAFDREGLGLLYLADDLDGDGLTELMDETVTVRAEDETVSLTPVRLLDNTPLWTSEATGEFIFHTWGGDVDGEGGGEVYRHVDSFDGQRYSTEVTALDGATGAGRWTFASRP